MLSVQLAMCCELAECECAMLLETLPASSISYSSYPLSSHHHAHPRIQPPERKRMSRPSINSFALRVAKTGFQVRSVAIRSFPQPCVSRHDKQELQEICTMGTQGGTSLGREIDLSWARLGCASVALTACTSTPSSVLDEPPRA